MATRTVTSQEKVDDFKSEVLKVIKSHACQPLVVKTIRTELTEHRLGFMSEELTQALHELCDENLIGWSVDNTIDNIVFFAYAE